MEEFRAKVTKKRASTEVEMIGRMMIDHVRELKAVLLTAFDRGKKVHVNLAQVSEVDLSSLQVLCSAHRLSISKNCEFLVNGRNHEVIVSAAHAAGLLRNMGCARDVNKTCVWTSRSL